MSYIANNLPRIAVALITLVIGLSASTAYSQDRSKLKEKQREFCSDNNWNDGERVSSRDLRETTISSTGRIDVDGGRNGGVSVKGEDRSDVLVRACVQAWGTSQEAAKAAVAGIRVNTAGTIKAESSGEDNNWSVSYDIRVPRNMDVSLTAHNGGISISSVSGKMEFGTTNGGVFLSDVSGDVRGRTTNGGVFVRLNGSTWSGNGLDVTTTNGGVKLELPETYAARVETETVNGGFKSSIPALNVTTEDVKGDSWQHSRRRSISTNLNGGGPTIRVATTNGGVSISTPN